jgi:hypothetical protein
VRHLFIDDHDVERIDNLARKLHQPQKFRGHAVVRPEHRWENCAIQIRTTPAWDPEASCFKMIYLASAESTDPEIRLDVTGAPAGGEGFYCYATSPDGVNWEKPALGQYDYQAQTWRGTPVGRENNILPSAHGMLLGPIHDPHAADPAQRFKGLAYRSGGLQPMRSADAIHWEDTGLPPLASADEFHVTLDEERRLFIASVKHGGPYGRSFYLTTSTDFSHWSDQELIFHADQTDQENGCERLQRFFDDPAYLAPVYNRPEEWRTDVYNFPVFPYEGVYLGLPVMHHWAGKHPPMYENVDSRKSVELASSRDLRHWDRVANRAVFIEHSPLSDGSAYDTGQIVTTNGPVRRNNELWFYYVGLKYRCLSIADTLNRRYLDAGAVCMARLRLDGFVSLKGGIEWGAVLTRPLRADGGELRVNADAWRGRVETEVVAADEERVLPGYSRADCVPLMADHTDARVRWKEKADLTELAGRSVRLRFHLLRSELYSFWLSGQGTET